MQTVREIERLTVYLPHAVAREMRLSAVRESQTLSAWFEAAAKAHLASLKQKTAPPGG